MDTTKSRPDARQVCVIGNGGWGTALSLLLLQNGHSVTLWGHSQEELNELRACGENKPYLPGVPIPETLRTESDPAKAVAGANLVVLVMPSQFYQAVCERYFAVGESLYAWREVLCPFGELNVHYFPALCALYFKYGKAHIHPAEIDHRRPCHAGGSFFKNYFLRRFLFCLYFFRLLFNFVKLIQISVSFRRIFAFADTSGNDLFRIDYKMLHQRNAPRLKHIHRHAIKGFAAAGPPPV